MTSFNCLPVSYPTLFSQSDSQLHETLNLYVSPTSYVFEPATSLQGSDGTSFGNEKDVRESLYVDRRTGRMALNGKSQLVRCGLCSWQKTPMCHSPARR